jgi:hypothetical protein
MLPTGNVWHQRVSYKGHQESKDCLAAKKNKQNKNFKNLIYHYYRP